MRPLGKDTISVKDAPLIADGHGNQVADWAHATSVTVTNCYLQHGETHEDLVNRDEVLIAWKLFAPAAAIILSTSRVSWQGIDYEVRGQPELHRGFSGTMDHLTADLVKWTG